MNWSFSEIRALSLKAARGSGLEWGQAEEVAHSILWLQERNINGVAALSDYLEWRSNDAKFDLKADPLILGSIIRDLNSWAGYFPRSIIQPILLLPAIAVTLGDNECVQCTWSNNEILLQKDALLINCMSMQQGIKPIAFDLKYIDQTLEANELLSRVHSDDQTHFRTLEQFAHKTYAPATEDSRNAGAGAGNDGND